MARNKTVTYYVREEDPANALRNGSFIRASKEGISRFILGDFDMFLKEIPRGYVVCNREIAEALIPDCCK